jgi:hypothetical protein
MALSRVGTAAAAAARTMDDAPLPRTDEPPSMVPVLPLVVLRAPDLGTAKKYRGEIRLQLTVSQAAAARGEEAVRLWFVQCPRYHSK